MGLLDSARRDFFPLLICRRRRRSPETCPFFRHCRFSLGSLPPCLFRWSFFSSTVGEERERGMPRYRAKKEGGRGRKGEHASLAPSKPPSAIFPPSPFHPESLSQERERERGRWRRRTWFGLESPLLSHRAGKEGGWRWHACECV